MSMDKTILGVLTRFTGGEALQMFEFVTIMQTEPSQECYLCIGKNHIWFVSKDMDRKIQGQQLAYLDIERAIVDTNSSRRFMLQLTYERKSLLWTSDRIVVSSQHRAQLLERIGLCWQAACMVKTFKVQKFMIASQAISVDPEEMLIVRPPKGYDDRSQHRGYSFWLRHGFKDVTGLRSGTFIHDSGWEARYNSQNITIPPGVQFTVHVHEVQSMMDLEIMCQDDIRTVAMEFKEELTQQLDQFYVLVSGPYLKRMNRQNDIASWDCWELFIRSKEYALACVLCRREYIPPLCDVSQDIAVLLRCPCNTGAGFRMTFDTCEVLMDECRYVADSIASTSEGRSPYLDLIQAKLDALQFNVDAYRWIKGTLKLTPCHEMPAAYSFVKSIVRILHEDGLLEEDAGQELLDRFDELAGQEIPCLKNPLQVHEELSSNAQALLLGAAETLVRTEQKRKGGSLTSAEEAEFQAAVKLKLLALKEAWSGRVARYFAYCLDGGLIGDRFTLSSLVKQIGKGTPENDKMLRQVVEFLLQARKTSAAAGRTYPLSQLLVLVDVPGLEEFKQYSFNDQVMRTLLMETYLKSEWVKKNNASGSESSYASLLSALLTSDSVGIGLRTLICRQILEQSNHAGKTGEHDKEVQVLVPALVTVLKGTNLSLTSCAVAALVNLSCDKNQVKTLLMSQNVVKLCMRQLKTKDDDLTLYTLYLLVNLTKTPHHRSVVVRHGGVVLLVDILTSSYQNFRKQKILAEVASVLGQLCNEQETRMNISEEMPWVVPCLLWVYDAAHPNTKLKSKLLFCLRQLCAVSANKLKVGQHVIPTVLDELGVARGGQVTSEECASNALLLLTMLADIHSNAVQMDLRLSEALEQCGFEKNGAEAKTHKFRSPGLWDKVMKLKHRVRDSMAANE